MNKVAYNVCPAFYKFKIHPFQWLFDQINYGNDESDSSLVTDIMFDETTIRDDLSDLGTPRGVKGSDTAVLNQKTMYTRRADTQYLDDTEKNKRVQGLREAR